MSDRPIIAITTRGRPFDAARTEVTTAAFEWITNAFAACVVRAGGVPLLISNECDPEDVGRLLQASHGLLLSGGEDVHPRHFGQTSEVDNLTINDRRDSVELAAIAAADTLGLPILGICRGIQVLNIARGGTIYQDLKAQYGRPMRDHSRGPSRVEVQTHDVALTPGSRLARIAGATTISGATDHHQAVCDIGNGLKVVGSSLEDGIIEAVEEDGERFVVAVQWHPESRPDDDVTLRLFAAFNEAAVAYAATAAVPT